MNKTKQQILFLQNRLSYTRDEQVYRELYYYFHPRLFVFVNGLVRNADIAEEIVSDVMIKIWLMENRLGYIENLPVYLFKAAKNAALTHLAKKKPENVELTEAIENTISDEDSHDQLQLTETRRLIESTVRSLPAQCQMVYRLVREEGLSYKQVSDVLDITQNTIETHMRIALKRIRLVLAAYLEGKH